MMNFFKVVFLCLILIGCQDYVQVFQTNSNITTSDEGFYVYENDSLRITYSFWKEKGLMTFSIFNKLSVPLYVDWKKSSYIDNSVKLNYWMDEEKSKTTNSYGSYFYNGPILKPDYAVSNTSGSSLSSKVKVERITFIPPSSHYYRSQFYILPIRFFKLDTETSFFETKRNDESNNKTKVYKSTFSEENSPLVFRNFLTFSLTESFDSEFYVDNEFYIEQVLEMEEKHFEQKRYEESEKGKWYIRDENGDPILFSDFRSPSSFYLRIPRKVSMRSRK